MVVAVVIALEGTRTVIDWLAGIELEEAGI